MEFITAEQFKEQPMEVQQVFLDWWDPSIGDIFDWIKPKGGFNNDLRKMECCNSENIVEMTECFKGIKEGDRIPLFTEGQLRKFIEDKTGMRLEFMMKDYNDAIMIQLFDEKSFFSIIDHVTKEKDVLMAYWEVACIVAKAGLDG